MAVGPVKARTETTITSSRTKTEHGREVHKRDHHLRDDEAWWGMMRQWGMRWHDWEVESIWLDFLNITGPIWIYLVLRMFLDVLSTRKKVAANLAASSMSPASRNQRYYAALPVNAASELPSAAAFGSFASTQSLPGEFASWLNTVEHWKNLLKKSEKHQLLG